MSLIDFILNLAALLIWLNWRSASLALSRPPIGVSIANNLQRTSPPPASSLAAIGLLLGILVTRGIFYHVIGPAVGWVPSLDLLAINLPWRSDSLLRMLIFSFTTFGLVVFAFYSWLLVLSAINRSMPDSEPLLRWVRHHLGVLEAIPAPAKLLLPILVAALLWILAYKPLIWMEIAPEYTLPGQFWQSCLVIALASVCLWRWLLLMLLLGHLLNTYVYLGDHSIWRFISITARNMLYPISFLRVGKMDLATITALTLLAVSWNAFPQGLAQLYRRLPI